MTQTQVFSAEQPVRTKSDVLASIGNLKQRIEEATEALQKASEGKDVPSEQQQEEMAEVSEFVKIYRRNLETEELNLQRLMRGERLTF
ncbi:hypothetical protein CJU90_3762 [Yarrowia sp. C11]|nr:hypothetical protein CKK34_5372 [Yarrowia sp. E02]KAG5367466.1 hypothetical protein CJU90_3762 [Yarrowia sp. C11]